MKKVKPFCAVVGVADSGFEVEIDEDATVSALKRKIKNGSDGAIKPPWPTLQLFLAKKGGEWLDGAGAAAATRNEDGRAQYIDENEERKDFKKMEPSLWINNDEYFGKDFKPREGEVHVLVVLPVDETAARPPLPPATRILTVHEEYSEKNQRELTYYRQRGERIRDVCGDYCEQVLGKIDAIYDEYKGSSDPLPFICVEGSSGMGKSQLAFALRGKRPWFYWLATEVTGRSQTLYQSFKSISIAFREAVKLDGLNDRDKNDILNSHSKIYSNEALWTCGFIRALLEYLLASDDAARMIRFEEKTQFNITKCRPSDVREVADAMTRQGKLLPFFVLDEMTVNGNDDAGKKTAAFQRNIFRVCGLVVVVMGTDSKISSLIPQGGGSYSVEHKWMSVVPIFPPYQLVFSSEKQDYQAIWEAVVTQFPVVEYIAMNSRGRFARYFVDKVVDAAKLFIESVHAGKHPKISTDLNVAQIVALFQLNLLLDATFATVSENTQAGKQFMSSNEGKFAQLMAISYTNAKIDPEAPAKKRQKTTETCIVKGTESMHLHFANLVDERITDTKLQARGLRTDVLEETEDGDFFSDSTAGATEVENATKLSQDQTMEEVGAAVEAEVEVENRVTGSGRYWTPRCRFPRIADDVLLYLAVLGGKQYSAYRDINQGVLHSTQSIFKKVGEFRVHRNTNAEVKDFLFYENMVAHAIFCSSRRNGVQGVPFNDFFENLLGEFQNVTWMKTALKKDRKCLKATNLLAPYDAAIQDLSKRTMPFLAPPNAHWPQEILDANKQGCKFGHLVRALNKERCDVYFDDPDLRGQLVGECKYHGKNVDMSVVRNIVGGFDKAWRDWKIGLVFCPKLANIQEWTCAHVDCVRIDSQTGAFEWVHPKNNPDAGPKVVAAGQKVLVVIETGV